MNEEVSFWIPRSGNVSGPLILREPEETLRLDAPGKELEYDGGSAFSHRDPFRAITEFINGHQTGYIAGFLGYELAHQEHDISVSASWVNSLPDLFLAYYPHSSDDFTASNTRCSLDTFTPLQSRQTYRRAVKKIQHYIRQGYVYQVNYTQRFQANVEGTLRSMTQAQNESFPPHSIYVRLGPIEIMSLSPERFLRMEGNRIFTEPIKGTRPRGKTQIEDETYKAELLDSEKDRAEHAMIVDLERNDLNRICEPGTVSVPRMMKLRSFPTVHHLVSRVRGTLRTGITPGEIFRETFPGGSITGAPKHTALRVINCLESRRRGVYTGTIGYWDLNRQVADWNIAIRTLVKQGNQATWDSGGGIVIDSDPGEEYQESLDKTKIVRQYTVS